MPELDIEHMISNPSDYGFEWGYGSLHNNGVQLTAVAPHIVHKDLELMRVAFGDDYFLQSANGQSARVRDQRLREDIVADRSLAKRDKDMKRMVLERALGRRSRRVTQTVVIKERFVANDGSVFETALEAAQHNLALQAEKLVSE